jgi:hypothetical protein
MGYFRRVSRIKDRVRSLGGCVLLLGALGGCSTTSQPPKDAGDAATTDSIPGIDESIESNRMCTYPDGGAPGDGGTFNSVCPTSGCPSGTVCVFEVGGVAGGGGEYCAPIPNECHGTPTCACMGSCVCTTRGGGQPETCAVQNGSIACDNGIR